MAAVSCGEEASAAAAHRSAKAPPARRKNALRESGIIPASSHGGRYHGLLAISNHRWVSKPNRGLLPLGFFLTLLVGAAGVRRFRVGRAVWLPSARLRYSTSDRRELL